jgi:hypothetical protein
VGNSAADSAQNANESAPDACDLPATEPAYPLPKFLTDRRGIPTSPELIRIAKKQYRRCKKREASAKTILDFTKLMAEETRLLRFMMEHAGKLDDNELADALEEIEKESEVAH